MIQCIAEHTVDTSLLNGGVCIDVGCLGFDFSNAMHDFGCEVYAFDIQDLKAPDWIRFSQSAISVVSGTAWYDINNDKQATNIINGGEISVKQISLNSIYEMIEEPINILKLDCEGAEYLILSDIHFKPIPQQISVEFHEHCQKDLHDLLFDKCIENLLKYYNPIKMDRYAAHGAGFNYWDCLFVKK
jgi:hypothetical protein